MSVAFRIFFGGLASWLNGGVSILLGLVLMPILFRHLSKEELGVWLLMGQSWAALGVFDLGFGIVLTRRIAFEVSRATRTTTGQTTYDKNAEVADLVATGK